jgi:hypothetical protein
MTFIYKIKKLNIKYHFLNYNITLVDIQQNYAPFLNPNYILNI